MRFMDDIVTWLGDIADNFYSAYQEVNGWVFPFYYLASPLYYLHRAFIYLEYHFGRFNEWLDWAAGQIGSMISIYNVYNYFRPWFENAIDAWDWIRNAWLNVGAIIDTWWSSTQATVIAWIDQKVAGIRALIDQVTATTVKLREDIDIFIARIPTIDAVILWWGNWPGNVNQAITTWWASTMGEVMGLIDSAFTIRSSFWAGWQDWRDKVAEFFTDPEDWLYKSVDRIIERFW